MANIWTAAAGDFERVKQLVESGTSPNVLDENSYSPLHAAASWGQADILRYLVEKGGNINLTDSDGETPLFVVETVGMAKLVVELGGDPRWRNEEGTTPAASLQEDYPHIALYLRTLTGETGPSSSSTDSSSALTSSTSTQPDLEAPTDELMTAVRGIMERSERGEITEAETDELLREVVERTVAGQVEAGRAIGEQMLVDDEQGEGGRTRQRAADELAQGPASGGKRSREDRDDIGR
ncbi:ankyrin repeat protein [Rhodotorula toruloides]|uniref:Ankyrin repeat protein n=1 Tax=Rhodotorula toruloides TaxID=5286 RepID=A0A511K986_RHOTO|nr:ankyrin repeat protein [Rhodotorula toruloides]